MDKGQKFISIIFKNTPKDSLVDMLVDFLKGLLGNYISYQYSDNFLTVIFNCDAKVDFEEIINGLNNDFYITTSLFESGILYSKIDINEYIEHIKNQRKNILDSNLIYVDEKTLVKLNLDGEIVKRNIFKSFYEDIEMLEVVKKYLDCNMNITQAANMLYMHRNTVMNKIDKFITVTGYDIKKFRNAFIIYKYL
jgi:DNA-binding protein Fis